MIDRCSIALDSAPLRVVYVFGVVFPQLVFTCFTLFSAFVENVTALSLLLVVLIRFWVASIEYHFLGKLTETIGTVRTGKDIGNTVHYCPRGLYQIMPLC